MGCVVENAALLNMVFLYVLVSSAGKCLRRAYHAVTGFPLKAKGKLYASLWVFLWPHAWGIVLLQQKTSNNPQKKVWIMKRIFLATVAALVVIVSASAQRLADVRAEATIITDKMIAELGIGPGYRNSILNINLAYLNSINSYRDIDAYGWERRNREMRRYLSPGQWRKYCNTYYFYRPIGWQDRAYVHHIYRRYPTCRPGKHHKHDRGYGRPGKHDKHDRGYGRPGKHDKHGKHHKHDKHDKHDRD